MTDSKPPDRLCADSVNILFDAATLAHSIHIFVDEKEYFDVEEYCTPDAGCGSQPGMQEPALFGL